MHVRTRQLSQLLKMRLQLQAYIRFISIDHTFNRPTSFELEEGLAS